MHCLLAKLAKRAFCVGIFAGILLQAETAYAAPRPQPQPPIFTPRCAARPPCIANVCLRSGRCTLGSNIQMVGCLIYTCRNAAH
jgi:hypothetical protein